MKWDEIEYYGAFTLKRVYKYVYLSKVLICFDDVGIPKNLFTAFRKGHAVYFQVNEKAFAEIQKHIPDLNFAHDMQGRPGPKE